MLLAILSNPLVYKDWPKDYLRDVKSHIEKLKCKILNLQGLISGRTFLTLPTYPEGDNVSMWVPGIFYCLSNDILLYKDATHLTGTGRLPNYALHYLQDLNEELQHSHSLAASLAVATF